MTSLETRVTIKRLHPLFVAEVTGIDLTVPIAREDLRTISDRAGFEQPCRQQGRPCID